MKRQSLFRCLCLTALVAAGGISLAAMAGCERKEKILDVEAPGVDVEVERSPDTGEVDVEVDK